MYYRDENILRWQGGDMYDGGFGGGIELGMQHMFRTIFMIYGLIIFAACIIGLVKYFLRGFALYRIASRKGMDNPWLAFVPFGRTYLYGEIGGALEIGRHTVRTPGIWLIVLPIIYAVVLGVCYFIFFILLMMGIAVGANGFFTLLFVLFILVFMGAAILYSVGYNVLRSLVNLAVIGHFSKGNMAIVHMLAFLFVPLYAEIYLFIHRNRPFAGDTSAPQDGGFAYDNDPADGPQGGGFAYDGSADGPQGGGFAQSDGSPNGGALQADAPTEEPHIPPAGENR